MEGFSLALLECESHGVPSISYDIQYGPGELIQDGKNGYLIEKNNQHMLFEKVKLLLNNPQLQQSFSHHCIETAKSILKHKSCYCGKIYFNILTKA